MKHSKSIFTFLSVILSFMFFLNSLWAASWEVPVEIAGDPGHEYSKPEVAFGPSGVVYVAYRDKNSNGGNSDIMLCRFDGKEMVYENVSRLDELWEKHKAFETDLVVDQNERVHVAWIGVDKVGSPAVHRIMYRYKEGDQWSPVFELGQLDLPESNQFIIDTRLAVDGLGNAHVVTCIDAHALDESSEDEPRELSGVSAGGSKTSWYVGKYGDEITPLYQLPGKKSKHPDIAVTDDFVHVVWMYKIGDPYAIFYEKWENSPNATKGNVIQLTTPRSPYSSQKARISLDDDGKMHIVEFHKIGEQKRLRYHREKGDGSFTHPVIVSENIDLLYHKADLCVRGNSVITTMQRGQSAGSVKNGAGVWYNWQQDGRWGECLRVPDSEGAVSPSTDLSVDGEIAAIAWSKYESHVMLITSAPVSATGSLETQFSQPDVLFWGSEVTFDASACIGLNPEYNIAAYRWDFGDGVIETVSSPTITHTYNMYNTSVQVKLTIIADNETEGQISKTLPIKALYGGIITQINPKRIRTLFFNRPANEIVWREDTKNAENGFPEIVRYEIWRAPQSTSITDGSYTYVGEVIAGEYSFLDYFGLEEGVGYVYAVRSVDSEGHISPFNNVSFANGDPKELESSFLNTK